MESKKNLITYKGLRKFEQEIEDLKINRRKEVAQKIKEAREQGDLSENAEYDAAKEEQGHIEARIEELEQLLNNAEVISYDDIDTSSVSIGCMVKLYDYEFEEEVEYEIVGSTEANVLEDKISNESLVGSAIMGAKVGDEVCVKMQDSELKFKILSISK